MLRLRGTRSGLTLDMNAGDLITIDLEILGGAPVFKGTRVPIRTLFEYLENNYSLEEFFRIAETQISEDIVTTNFNIIELKSQPLNDCYRSDTGVKSQLVP